MLRPFQRGYDDRLAHRKGVPDFASIEEREMYEDGVRAAEFKMGFEVVDAKVARATRATPSGHV